MTPDEVKYGASKTVVAVYTNDSVALDDPSENYHEASKLYASFALRDLYGRVRLETSPELLDASTRAAKRHCHHPTIELPTAEGELATLLRRRRSARTFARAALPLKTVSSLLFAGYGVTERHASGLGLRTVPSGGALYPLDIYCVLQNVDGVEDGLYSFDPVDHSLARHQGQHVIEELKGAVVQPELVDNANVVFLIVAMFWRNRFKYGPRAYRFALLEAGHVGQNIALATEEAGLGSISIGGTYDRRIDELLQIDGVNESIVYTMAAGHRT